MLLLRLCHLEFAIRVGLNLLLLLQLPAVLRSYRTLDQRIMHRLSLGLPPQLARAP